MSLKSKAQCQKSSRPVRPYREFGRHFRLWTLDSRLWTSIFFACLGGGFVACTCVHGEPSSLSTNSNIVPAPVQRPLEEAELVTLLTDTLQRENVKTRGELELRLTRPWAARTIPDAPLTIKVLELPNAGVTANCIVRFALLAGDQKLGEWQTPLQARIWREAWVARAALKRGDNLADAELGRERRDVINLRDPLAEFAERDATLEIAEPLSNGALLLGRSVKLKAVIRRGQLADAMIEDGALRVTLKVEALEDGAPGQIIRARNPQTRRDLRGKVLNEQTIAIAL
jgi:flagella basal body P-ring formation protein FlgA